MSASQTTHARRGQLPLVLLATLIGTDFLTGEILSRLFQNAAEGFFRPLEGQGRRAGRPRAADYRHGQTCQRHLSRMEAVLNGPPTIRHHLILHHSRELTTPVQLLCMRRESENMPRAPSAPATKDLTPEERRKRSALRREKQREHNILRAAKMHKARLKSHLKAETSRDLKETVYVGCSGWRCWKWRDPFYATVPQAEWFRHYSGTFDTVEINPSFYSWPTVAGVQAWRSASTSRISRSSRAPKRSLGFWDDRRHPRRADGVLALPAPAKLPLHQSPSEFDRKPARPRAA